MGLGQIFGVLGTRENGLSSLHAACVARPWAQPLQSGPAAMVQGGARV